MDMEEVGNGVPELLQSRLDHLQDSAGIGLSFCEGHQLLMAMTARELCQCLLGDSIIRAKGGIILAHISPQLRRSLHHGNNVVPFLRVLLAQRLGPQMGIFVYRCLRGGDVRVDIDLTVIDKAISLTLPATEEHRLALCHILTHLTSHLHRVPRLFVFIKKRHILGLHIPTLRVLIHEAHEHLVIETLHAIGTDNHLLAVELLTLHGCLDLVGHRLANHLGELLALVTFGIAECDMAVRLHKEIDMTNIDLQVNEGTALIALQLLDLVFIEDNLL